MSAPSLVDRLRAAREQRVEVEAGRFLRLRRPLEAHMHRLREVTVERVAEHVVGWEGVLDQDLLPPGVGGSDPAEFSPEAVLEVLGDKPEWAQRAMAKLVDMVNAHFAGREAAAKN